mgnify:CR=1 FL=1
MLRLAEFVVTQASDGLYRGMELLDQYGDKYSSGSHAYPAGSDQGTCTDR